MTPTRRSFLKIGAAGAAASVLGFDLQPAYAQSRDLKISRTTETRSIARTAR
jgi:anaerobic selenocysteine-containing dehydrogenase